MPPQDQGQPASWDDYIKYEATQQGVSPLLALAVAKKESSVNPNAIGDSGKAVGMFQLHEAAAKDAGNVDRADPLQNIKGGVTYLKQLDARYKGDVNKILQAYNGGMDGVDKGTVSPAAQAYAAEVIAHLSQGMRQAVAPPAATRAPITGRGTGTQNVAVEAKQNAMDFTRAYDPRTTEGRENLAGTAGSIALATATRGMPVGALTTRIASLVGPVLGAAGFGAGERATEEAIGSAPSTPGSIPSAGLTQGAYELAGQAFMWPVRRIFRTLMAPKIATAAAEGLKTEATATRQAGRDAVDAVRTEVQDVARATRRGTSGAVAAATGTAAQQTAATKTRAASDLAALELRHAEDKAAITRQYDNLLAQPPSTTGTASAVKATVEGPSKRALDAAGRRVGEAAETGPALDLSPVLDKVDEMVGMTRPEIIFPAHEAAPQIGFGGLTPVAPRAPGIAAGPKITLEEYKKLVAGKLGVSEASPLPGLLGKIQSIANPKEVGFADAHQIKMLLDEAVNWDRVAKKHLERLTKGTRNTLRSTMADAGHQPYEDATAAYRAVIPLYRRGIGKQIIQLSQAPEGAARVAQMLKSNDPISARALQQLLVDQSAAGGDAELGQKAWDAVRSSYTYDHIISGGVSKLGDRLQRLITERPEFVKVVYGDNSGKQILHNLGALSEALSHAEVTAAEQVGTQKGIGQAAVGATEARGAAQVGAAKSAALQARETAARTGATRIREANRAAGQANRAVAEKAEAFKESSLAKFTRRSNEQEATDVVRAGLLSRTYVGTLSLMRLLRSPRGGDIIQWMAYSPRNTQRAVRVLTSPVDPPVVAALLKDIYNAFPTAETKQSATP